MCKTSPEETTFYKMKISKQGLGLGKQPNNISFQVNILSCVFPQSLFILTINHMHSVSVTKPTFSTFSTMR